MFGLWSYGIVASISECGRYISAKLIHPDDADYDYDPDFRVPLTVGQSVIEAV